MSKKRLPPPDPALTAVQLLVEENIGKRMQLRLDLYEAIREAGHCPPHGEPCLQYRLPNGERTRNMIVAENDWREHARRRVKA